MERGKHRYTTKIRQPQTVGGVKIVPKGGELSQAEYDAIEKDAYGSTLIEKGMISVECVVEVKDSGNDTQAVPVRGKPPKKPDAYSTSNDGTEPKKNSVPTLEGTDWLGASGKAKG